jgi:hypothetical protein
MESYIETVSGKKFFFLDPKEEDFDIKDIAHALSLNCRFTGHCNTFYSVAEHCWHMSRMAPEEHAFACLLHDASEAYITDVASPIKQHLPEYIKIEERILSRLFNKYNLPYPMSPIVKYLDRVMLSTEAYYLIPSKGVDWELWGNKRPPVQHTFRPLGFTPDRAKQLFLDRFYELKQQHELFYNA